MFYKFLPKLQRASVAKMLYLVNTSYNCVKSMPYRLRASYLCLMIPLVEYSRMKFCVLISICIIYYPSFNLILSQVTPKKSASSSKSRMITEDLESALKSKDEMRIAKAYENLSTEYELKSDLSLAEIYCKKSLEYYHRIKDKNDIARMTRRLAIIQESLLKVDDAKANYRKSEILSEESKDKDINAMDGIRLENSTNTEVKKDAVRSKIEVISNTPSKTSTDTQELSKSYEQMGDVLIAENKYEEAAIQYQAAQNIPGFTSSISSSAQEKFNSVLHNIQNTDSAIYLAKNQFEIASSINDYSQMNLIALNISELYLKLNNHTEQISWLRKAYNCSKNGNDLTAYSNTLERVISFFKKQKLKDSIIYYQQDFIQSYSSLFARDTSFFDNSLLFQADERIKQLEREQTLSEDLVKSKNLFNYFLIAMITALSIAVFFLFRSLKSLHRQNKKIALQSLRREMNPHFIFNSLNSVNQFISSGNEREANAFLSKFSVLMRKMMENSNHDFIDLSEELEFIQSYLEIECKRFNQSFEYKIEVEENVQVNEHIIPTMLLQPLIENSIWHGIRYLKTNGLILIKIRYSQDIINITIEDNGIGISKSKELKTEHQKHSKARGSSNVIERIILLNQLHHLNINLKSEEKTGEHSGMIHNLKIPKTIRIQ